MKKLFYGLCVLALGLGLIWGLRDEAGRVPKEAPAPAPLSLEAPAALPAPVAKLPPADELPPAVQRYLESTVYPPSSGRLTADHVDLLEPNRRHERPRPLRNTLGPDPDAVVFVELSADRYDLTGGQASTLWLEARRGGDSYRLGNVRASLYREGRAGREGDPVPLRFAWRDRRYEAELDPRKHDEISEHHGFLVAEVSFEAPAGTEQVEILRFNHTPPGLIPARFTGQFHDYVRDGALRVEVGLEVDRPGFYRLDANLYDASGAPVAFTSYKGIVGAGPQHLPLEVFGKVLRDARAVGPYTVGELRGYRFVDGGFPDREVIPALPSSHQTGSYALEEFSEEAWESEAKLRVVELMLEDEARGIAVDAPPLASAPAENGPGVP